MTDDPVSTGDAVGGAAADDDASLDSPEQTAARRAEARRLADTMRRAIERLVATRAPAEGLAVAADRLEALVEYLDPWPQGALYEGFSEAVVSGDPSGFFDHSPMMGRANPLAPPLELLVEDGKVGGRGVFGSAYEGPPGCVHGGLVAAAFDDVLGLANTLSGKPGMTGTLTIVYRSPTPLHTELTFTGWVDRREGRKTFCKGEIHAGERLCAEAEGIFIAFREGGEQFEEMKERRARQLEQARSAEAGNAG